ncbi:MAG: HAMP domain-containing protein [Anaerolineae bacterium]|nr:HAMP domain-containing protein [Anaerolineae bacterium]
MKLLRFVRDLSLGIKLNAALVIAFVVMLLVPLGVASTTTHSLIINFAKQRTLQELQVVQSHFEEQQATLLAQARLLAKSQDLLAGIDVLNTGQVQSTVVSAAASFNLDSVEVVDSSGNQIAAITRADLHQNPQAAKRLLSVGLAGAEVTELYPEQEQNPNLMMAATAPLKNAGGVVVGALLMSREVDTDYLADIRFRRAGAHLAVIYEGKVLTAEAAASVVPTAQDGLNQALGGQNWADDQLVYTTTGAPLMLSYGPLRINGEVKAVIAILGEHQELLALERGPLANMGLGIGIVALIVVAFSILFMRLGVTNPLSRLQKVAERMAQGDFTQRAQADSKDEMGRLSIAFNQMVEAIQQRDAELVMANQTLEQRVEERTKELRKANALAQESVRLKSEFMSTMSHELRTPLNAIIGFCGIMLEGMGGEIDDDARHMLDRINGNSTRLLSLINEVLDLAKIEAGRLELVSEPMSVRGLVERWRSQIAVLAEQKGLTFDVEIDPLLPEKLYGDSERLTQIIVNLLSNAFKFTEKGGVKLTLGRQDSTWLMQVSDSGIGIPPHAINYIFDEFRQVDGSSRRVYGGTGLGLSIVRHLSRIMNGSVSVSSELGKGSVFTVKLPLIAVNAVETETPVLEVAQA